eukprot:COSAG02_NODE_713_length_18120_cov_27.173409_14_plen_89_part_00
MGEYDSGLELGTTREWLASTSAMNKRDYAGQYMDVEEAWIYTVPLASATASFSTGSSNVSVPLAPALRMRPSKPEQKRPDNDSSNAEL